MCGPVYPKSDGPGESGSSQCLPHGMWDYLPSCFLKYFTCHSHSSSQILPDVKLTIVHPNTTVPCAYTDVGRGETGHV